MSLYVKFMPKTHLVASTGLPDAEKPRKKIPYRIYLLLKDEDDHYDPKFEAVYIDRILSVSHSALALYDATSVWCSIVSTRAKKIRAKSLPEGINIQNEQGTLSIARRVLREAKKTTLLANTVVSLTPQPPPLPPTAYHHHEHLCYSPHQRHRSRRQLEHH